jgi:YggT family protein
MFLLSNLLNAFANLLNTLIWFVEVVIVLRVILSWAQADPYNGFVRVVYSITEPLLKPLRRLLPPWKLGGLDLSPFLAFIILEFIKDFLVRSIYSLSSHIG